MTHLSVSSKLILCLNIVTMLIFFHSILNRNQQQNPPWLQGTSGLQQQNLLKKYKLKSLNSTPRCLFDKSVLTQQWIFLHCIIPRGLGKVHYGVKHLTVSCASNIFQATIFRWVRWVCNSHATYFPIYTGKSDISVHSNCDNCRFSVSLQGPYEMLILFGRVELRAAQI